MNSVPFSLTSGRGRVCVILPNFWFKFTCYISNLAWPRLPSSSDTLVVLRSLVYSGHKSTSADFVISVTKLLTAHPFLTLLRRLFFLPLPPFFSLIVPLRSPPPPPPTPFIFILATNRNQQLNTDVTHKHIYTEVRDELGALNKLRHIARRRRPFLRPTSGIFFLF